jgi:hypothetical protein
MKIKELVAEYLAPLVSTTGTTAQPPKYKTPQEHIAAMDAIAAKNANAPILPDSAFDRENIYEDRL